VRISDTGPGIAPAHRARIFDCRFRGQQLATPECRLRPLVYQIDKRIVELHRGDLAVASHDAGGTDVVSDRRRLAVTQK